MPTREKRCVKSKGEKSGATGKDRWASLRKRYAGRDRKMVEAKENQVGMWLTCRRTGTRTGNVKNFYFTLRL